MRSEVRREGVICWVAWHGLINYKQNQNKMSASKKLTCKGTLKQVFIRVYRLVTQSVMLVFDLALRTIAIFVI